MNKSSRKDLLHGTLEMLILETLSLRDLHGYGIAREIERTSREELQIEEGSLYPALHRMERRGWLNSQWGRSENGRRAKLYRLTESGRLQLAQEKDIWTRFWKAVSRVIEDESA